MIKIGSYVKLNKEVPTVTSNGLDIKNPAQKNEWGKVIDKQGIIYLVEIGSKIAKATIDDVTEIFPL